MVSVVIPNMLGISYHFFMRLCPGLYYLILVSKQGDFEVPHSDERVQNLCWLMMIADYTTQYIGDYNSPIEGSL